MIPNVAVIRIESPHGTTIPLWIPLILLWIPLLLLSPLILLVILAAGRLNRGKNILLRPADRFERRRRHRS